MGLNGKNHKGLCMKTSKLLEDCIMFHKLTGFHCDAAERQKAYMMDSLRKLFSMTVQNHVRCCETLNGYITLLPMLRDSASAVDSTKKGNISFNDAMAAGIILATCPTEWRNQYEMNHKTFPESARAMLYDLENIEKVYVECANDKAKANKAKASTAPKSGGQVPRKHGREGSSKGPAPKKRRSAKYCKWCKAAGRPFTTHNTAECCMFDREGKQLAKPTKPFDSAKKPLKKGDADSGQMAYLLKKVEKLKRKLKKTRKHSKKCARDLLGSDSESD
jgi:hypothetical protein